MTGPALSIAGPQPDIVLDVDAEGVIRRANLADHFAGETFEDWVGRPWAETVADVGRDKILHLIQDATTAGVSGFRQVNQRFPSGVELPVEYTAVRLGREGHLIAVGKSLQSVAELQTRLNAAQEDMERRYWKLRDVETRCRLLFDRTNEAVLLVRASDLRVVEANPAAMRALDISVPTTPAKSPGRSLLQQVADPDRPAIEALLVRVRNEGKAPAILVHLGSQARPWLVRASLLPSQEGLSYLLQLEEAVEQPLEGPKAPWSLLLNRSPDSFVVIDRSGSIVSANGAFLALVQVAHEAAVTGQPLDRWLGRPGADTSVLMSSVAREGVVRLFTTALHGELGYLTEVEVSACSDDGPDSRVLGLLIRDVGTRVRASSAFDPGSALQSGEYTAQIGRVSLTQLVKEAASAVERECIEAALDHTKGNRTAAAELLGVSRQSLHSKLSRYAANGGTPPPNGEE